MNKHAIITGDIVSSRKIKPAIREKLYRDLEAFLKSIKKQWITGYEIYRGDSIQCEAISPAASLRIALMIKSFVMAYIPPSVQKKISADQSNGKQVRGYLNAEFDIRLAIGVGVVDFIKKSRLSNSDGPAFQLSGETLDTLKEDYPRIGFKTDDEKLNNDIEALILLIDAVTQKWTQNQAAFALSKLQKKKDEEIALDFQISLSAVNQRKKTAQWFALEKAIEYFESKFSA